MSTDIADASAVKHTNRETERNILRYALGVMSPVCVMVIWQWEMAYVTPTLVTMLIGPPAKPLPKKLYFYLAMAMLASLALGLVLIRLLEPYPLVAILVMGGSLYAIFYKTAQGVSLLITALLLLSVLTYPSLAMLDIELSLDTALGVSLSYLIALFSAAIMYSIMPPAPISAQQVAPPEKKRSSSFHG